ncbi:protein adenylyltransferase SelO family protein [Moraxella cuniculi]|uniref:Protein nucleotidyltransferase YdiU n=1 Tax=Moraxella cuniculi TaxID=34061 RepID=A0A448GW80_9GAMM|nr:YdiU family protein [Moraxella cuniculi]VEG13001.1 Uncharacterized conserved protein [Moraxella cuniculi]
MKFIHDYLKHDDRLYRHILPTPLDNPTLIALNRPLIDRLGLNNLNDNQWCNIISGRLADLANIMPTDIQPIAMAYAGHQFGQWAGQLGDGRGLLIAQLKDNQGRLTDLHLKGAGRTPYSRHGDGRAMLASTIREYLCGHAMNQLGIDSSDAIGLVISDTTIRRQYPEKAAALLRVSDCHVRLGHFQWVSMYTPDNFGDFVGKIAQSYYPALYHSGTKTVDIPTLLCTIANRTALMIANWQLVGFCHGVMNTDNLNITGSTLDFGPFGFMERFNPHWINNQSDHMGRYSYHNQPAIGRWNLAKFLQSFGQFISQDDMEQVLISYDNTLQHSYHDKLCQKLGINKPHTQHPAIIQLGNHLLDFMQTHRLDFTNTFRSLIALVDGQNHPYEKQLLHHGLAQLPQHAQAHWQQWATEYLHELRHTSKSDIISTLQQHNPIYVLRNHMADRAIMQAYQGDFAEVQRLFALLSNPYQPNAIATADDTRPARHDEIKAISCMS